jgi:hypothetical protein
MASRSRCRREIFSDSSRRSPNGRGMRSGSVIIGDLPDGHLMCGRRAVDLAYRHLAEGAHQAALPLGWQRLPDRTGQPIAHRVIQASAPRRIALEHQVSAARRFVSNYQRRLLWDIELAFKRLKSLLHIDKLPARCEIGARSWLYPHLILALLCDDLSQFFWNLSPQDLFDAEYLPESRAVGTRGCHSRTGHDPGDDARDPGHQQIIRKLPAQAQTTGQIPKKATILAPMGRYPSRQHILLVEEDKLLARANSP